MQKADSADPAKYLPEMQKISYDGATGHIEFDDKGDRKNAEITIFTLKDGKVVPIAVVKGGKSSTFDDFMKTASAALRRPQPLPRWHRPRPPQRRLRPPSRRSKVRHPARCDNGALRGAVFFDAAAARPLPHDAGCSDNPP